MSNQKKYWKGLEELNETKAFVNLRDNEFAEELPMEEFLGNEKLGETKTGRRDFLKFLGFSVTAAAVAACETPVQKALPYVIKPENITPGVPNYYATTFFDDDDYANVLVKTREGRPILIETSLPSVAGQRGISAKISASVLSLYDGKRTKTAMKAGKEISWSTADTEIGKLLGAISGAGKKTVVLTSTIISPSTRKAIADFAAKFPGTEHVQYDSISYSALPKANQAVNGKAVIPTHRFENALAIASFGADFLGTWLDSNAFSVGYSKNRDPKGKMNRMFAFESVMSLTGANADYRTSVKQSEIALALIHLYNKVTGASVQVPALPYAERIAKCAEHLKANRGKALVVCGLNDVNAQIITAEINKALGANGTTLDFNTPLYTKQGNEQRAEQVLAEIASGAVQGVIFYQANPVYNAANGDKWAEAIKKLKLSVSFAGDRDETAALATYTLPDHNYLESWNDHNPYEGFYSLTQPTIHPLFDTRHAQENFIVWAGLASRSDKNSTAWREYIKENWRNTLFGRQSQHLLFDDFWNYSVHDGVFTTTAAPVIAPVAAAHADAHAAPAAEAAAPAPAAGDVSSAAAALVKTYGGAKGVEVVLYQKTGIGSGSQAANPWLQEFPDPISRITWDNYITMSLEDMEAQGFSTYIGQNDPADLAILKVNGKEIKLPVVASPGQKSGTVGVAVGYGRKVFKDDAAVGANAFPLATLAGGEWKGFAFGGTIEKTGETYAMGATQTHHTMMGRDIVKETSYKQFKADPASGNHIHTFHTGFDKIKGKETHGHLSGDEADFWKKFDRPNHNWKMSIDLNACNGCGACVIACHAENNVPVVGKDEIRRVRDMHWLRIDRYYSSDASKMDIKNAKGLGDNLSVLHEAEVPSAEPQVVFQPVMCQHCSQAPCETVCPVLATTHSNEGLNQMTYNRCIGTRYCANNCPYKVRRFNWFKYHDNDKFDFYMNDDLGKMVLNPDVTVRGRGVMEKCSMCAQRIQYGKLEAKKEGRRPKDGEIKMACQLACSTNAIKFGDANDEASEILALGKESRAYRLLDEVGTEPNVFYHVKVRNVEEEYDHGHHAGGHAEGHGAEHGAAHGGEAAHGKKEEHKAH